jgi:LemA protein
MTTYLVLFIFLIVLVWLIKIYNHLVQLRNQVDAAWSDISVQLKRRHDLIPKLVDAVKQYAQYEQTVLARITTLRSESQQIEKQLKPAPNKTGEIEKDLSQQVQKLIFLAEAYPDLKASRHFIDLQSQLSHVEDQLQHSRRFYNGAVRLLNTQIDTFPDMLVARVFNYQYRQYFQLELDS